MKIPYGRQHIDQDDIDAVVNVLESDWLTQGPNIAAFENMLAEYHKCKYAVAFSSGTAALHGAYYVSTKLPFGKRGKTLEDGHTFLSFNKPTENGFDRFRDLYWEFITTPITFAATANAGLYCGGKPVFADIDLNTYCIDIEKIEAAITEDTRVITPVSYAGYPADIKSIKALPEVAEHNICIIHDACHAIGARRDGHGIADFADMTVLSFHPVKHITTGEGGMVLTNNKDYYDKLLLFRNHGITKDENLFSRPADGDWYYEMQELGYNYRMTDFQCALGISQMKKLDENLYARNRIAKAYEVELSEIEWLDLPPSFDKTAIDSGGGAKIISHAPDLNAYHLYVLRVEGDRRKEFYGYLKEKGIYSQIHYIPVNRLPYYSKRLSDCDLKNSEEFYKQCISIPMFASLSDEDLSHVIRCIKEFR